MLPASTASEHPPSRHPLTTEEDLAALLRDSGPAVCALLLRKFGSLLRTADVEDMIVVALNRVWHHRDRFDPGRGTLRAWFYRIADHAAQDLLKRGWHKSRQVEFTPEDSFWETLHSRKAGSAGATVHPATRDLVLSLLDALPEVQRRILWADALCPDGGPANSEWLAADLGIPSGTVRVYRKRGLDRLRALLAERGIHPN